MVQAQLWTLNKSYEESLKLLEETNAAVEMHNNGCSMDFTAIHVQLVSPLLFSLLFLFAINPYYLFIS